MTPEERSAKLEEARLLTEQARRRMARTFREFLAPAFRAIEPGTDFQSNWHIDVIAEHLQAVTDGELRKLIINIPPGHMKSLSVSVLWPAWEWISLPMTKYLCASYGGSLALRDAVRMRRLIESPWYQELWPHVQLEKDQNAKEKFDNVFGGFRSSSGIGGSILGHRGDRLIVDDAHKTQEAESKLLREAVIEWYKSTMLTRAKDPRTSAQVVIAQRVHESDLPGHLLNEGGWTHLNLPQEYEEKPFVHVKAHPPLTADPRTTEGELLWPARFGPEEVADTKKQGTYYYSAQYQQRPAPAGGGLIKREWFKYYDVDPNFIAQGCEPVIQSWDLSVKGAATSDHVSGQVWGKRGADVYLIARVNDTMNFPTTCRAIETLSSRWPMATKKLVEDKANGPAAIDELRHKVPGLVAVPVRGDKLSRLVAVSGYVEAGNVWLPSPAQAPWVEDFIAEVCGFPKAPHDDDTDAFSQALDDLYVVGATWDMAAYAADLKQDRLKQEQVGYQDPTWKETITPAGVSRMKTIGEAPLLPEYQSKLEGW